MGQRSIETWNFVAMKPGPRPHMRAVGPTQLDRPRSLPLIRLHRLYRLMRRMRAFEDAAVVASLVGVAARGLAGAARPAPASP